MLFAVIGSTAGKSRDAIMAVYPRHKAFVDQFLARGEVVGIGPFVDAGGGNMALFRTRAAAEGVGRDNGGRADGRQAADVCFHEASRAELYVQAVGPRLSRVDADFRRVIATDAARHR